MNVSLTDKWIENALRSAELINSDNYVDCNYQDVITAIMTAVEQEEQRAALPRWKVRPECGNWETHGPHSFDQGFGEGWDRLQGCPGFTQVHPPKKKEVSS